MYAAAGERDHYGMELLIHFAQAPGAGDGQKARS
jgi:hypothetical protein